MKQYKKLSSLPSGQAGSTLTQGTLVLEGGGWKGLYTLGVLDAMMENDVNFSSVVGVSAGALSAMGYVSGQIGWGARIDLQIAVIGVVFPFIIGTTIGTSPDFSAAGSTSSSCGWSTSSWPFLSWC